MVLVTDKKYYLHETLKENLDILVDQIKKDWYFIIVISGSNRVRVGKSTLAQQIAYYLTWCLGKKYDFSNLVFDPEDLPKKSLEHGKYDVIHYDEARSGFDSKKAMEGMQKYLMDFLA